MRNQNTPLKTSKSLYEFKPNKLEPKLPFGPVYSPEKILSLKPNTTETPKEYQLKSQGYVILKQFEENNNLKTGPLRKPRTLRIHEDRFIPSIMRKKYVEGDEEEERKFAVQTCLNRLNFKNSIEIQKSLKELKANNELIVNLLIDRASVDEELPEKNSHLKNFAQLAIEIAASDKDFKSICQKKSLEKYNELIKNQYLKINIIECLIVWISHLLMGKVIKRRQYFQCLEMAIKYQNSDTAVGIIRASYYTCGKYLDEKNFSESATFYYYMQEHKPSTGYLEFLRDDLIKMRNAKWNEQFFQESNNKTETALLDAKKSQDELREKLLDDYTNWYNDPEFGTPRMPRQATLKEVVNAVIMNYSNELEKLQPQIEDYSAWFGLLLKNAENDNKELPSFLKNALNNVKAKNLPKFGDFMIGFFTILGGLYENEQIKFNSIVSFDLLTKPEYIDAVGRMTYIDQNEIYDVLYNQSHKNNNSFSSAAPALSSIASAPVIRPPSAENRNYSDSIIASLANITYKSDNLNKGTEYEKAVNFSKIVYSAFEENEDVTDPKVLFDGCKNELADAAKLIRKELVTEIWNKIISNSQMPPEFIEKARKYFHENIILEGK